MIQVMNYKPKVSFFEGHNDMSHYHPSHWTVGAYSYWLTDDQYTKFVAFTEPSLKNPPKIDVLISGSINEVLEKIPGTSYADKVKHAIALNPSHLLIWEFNALKNFPVPDNQDAEYIRSIIVLGERNFYVPTWFDLNIRLPIYEVVCTILNFTNRGRVKREIALWDKFLEDMHREKKHGIKKDEPAG
jgi:hypothetical protein